MSADLEGHLRAAMRDETVQVAAGPNLAGAVRERFRRHRRRRRAAAGAAVAVLVVASSTGLTLARSGADTAEIRPARPSPATAPVAVTTPVGAATPVTVTTGAAGTVFPPASGRDVGGVGVTWLPAGMSSAGPSAAALSPFTPGALAYRSDFQTMAGGRVGFVAVTAQWGNVPTLAAVEDDMRAAQPQRTFARTTVRGRSALLTRMDAKEEFSLVWIERDGLVLDVAAGTPVSEDDMRRVAEELTVGSRPRVDPSLDRAVRAAVAQVFTGGTSTGRTLAAVENGEELAPGLERHRAQHPGLARTLRVTVHEVAPRDATHAAASISLTYTDPTMPLFEVRGDSITDRGRPATYDALAVLVRTGKGWQVSRDTFCQLALGVCPLATNRPSPAAAPSTSHPS
ncbi:hypothetical protein CC117_07055 [Parafrankia colletiae]|uniref:Uncharacterized protein n=1 Tax=Parafrankia colletiae TaxID=573497 RepID=A0A1S1QAQ2_9ACTN|nr:hypothetical protein [Parafrankia colletiae]MCK9899675.1 hypothetical protein [Frankia sp. Cpl3]OHV30666.1 hypothetical protein CC117_07055 [Parafrankia colletiae]